MLNLQKILAIFKAHNAQTIDDLPKKSLVKIAEIIVSTHQESDCDPNNWWIWNQHLTLVHSGENLSDWKSEIYRVYWNDGCPIEFLSGFNLTADNLQMAIDHLAQEGQQL